MTLEFKGTKGNWHAVNYAGFYSIQNAPDYGEKDLLNYDHDLIKEPVPVEEAAANAQLMSAAPDLLDALVDFLREFDRQSMTGMHEQYNNAEKAIEKALSISKPSPNHSHIVNGIIN